MKQEKPNQPMAGKRSRSDDPASSSTSNGNSSSAASARQDGEPKAGGNARDVERNENATDFFKNRFKRHNPSKNIASGSESAARGGGFTAIAEALTPAEASLLKALNTDVAGGNGVAGLSGLDRLMRVMINAPDREARALCLELLIRSKDDADVMKGFVERRGLTFIKGWLAEETTSVAMIKLLLSVAKVLPVTYSSLKQSDAGRALKALYKHADPGVKKQAKAVIAHWKNELVRDEGEIAKHREKLDALHDDIKAKQAAAKKAKDDAEKAEKLKRRAIRAQNRPPNGTEAPPIISAPPAPLLYKRSSSNNSSVDSDPGAPVPSKAVTRAGMFDDDPLAAIGAPGAASGLGTTTGGSAAGTGSARSFPGRKFPTRGSTRGRGAAAIGAGSGRGSRGSVLRGGGGVAAGRGSATAATAAATISPSPAPAGRSGGILKVSVTPSPSKEEGIEAGEVIGAVGGTDTMPAQAPASVTATAAPATKVADSGTGAGEVVSLVAPAPAPTKAPAPAPASVEGSSDVAIPAGGGGAVLSAPGPPPIVSLDEMARADAAEKKRKRKARPAGKKVGWADRAGKILQIVKEFHPEDAALVVSEEPQEETPGANEAAALLQHQQHHHHKHWAERVKREREMERKFHGKSGGRARGTGGEDEGAGPGARGVELAAASRRRTMMPAVSWRRPGLYQEGVVHEFVMTLEVESSEAEGQAARTRAGLEVVYLSSGDIPPSPAEPDAASFLPADGTHSSPYEIPFYMETELEQMQADQEQEKEQQHKEKERQQNSPSPPPPRLTYEQMKALEAALATVDPHAAAALRSRFSQEPRLLQALLVTEGQVNTVLLRSLCQQALSTPSNVHLTLPSLPTATAGASPTGQQQQQSTLRASPSPAAVPAAVAGTPYPHQPQLPPPPPPRLAQPAAPGAAPAGSFGAPGAVVSQTPQGVVAGAVIPPAAPQQANTFGAAPPAAGAPSVILGAPQHLPPPPPPPPPAAFAAPTAGPHQAVPIQPNAPPHQPAFFGVQTPGAVAAPAAPQGMGLPPNPPPPVIYHQQQQPQQQQIVPPGMPGPGPGPGPGGQAGPPLGIEAGGGGGPGFGHEGARDGWEGGGGRGGRGIGGVRKERDGDRGRRMMKPIFCRYHNAKVQMCTNDPCRFIHDLNHYPDEHRPRVRSYGGFTNRDRDSGDRERERDWDRRDRGGRDWERRDRRDRGEREERTSERDGRDGDGGEEAGDGRDTGRGGRDTGRGGRGRGGGGLDSRDRSDGRGSDDKRARYR